MDGPTPLQMTRSQRRRIPTGLIGALAMIAIIESFIARHPRQFSSPTYIEWEHGVRAIKRDAAKAKILCLGDSLVKNGLSPAAIEAQTGRPSYNLAVSGGQPLATYTMLRRALDAGIKPEAVVVDFKWTALQHDYNLNRSIWPALLRPSDAIELSRSLNTCSIFGEVLTGQLFPSVRGRFEVRSYVLGALRGQDMSTPIPEFDMCRKSWKVNHGAMLRQPHPLITVEPDPANTMFFPTAWSVHPVNAKYIDKFFKLAKESKIKVFLTVMPVSPKVLGIREQIGAETPYTEFLTKLHVHYPEVVVIDARGAGFPNESFFDSTHLNYIGAEVLSHTIGGIVRDRLDRDAGIVGQNDSWVSLPSYPKGQVAVRDFQQLSEKDRSQKGLRR